MALQYQKQQKRDPAAWLQKVTGHAPSAATQELFNAQREGRYVGVAEYGESRGPGGRRLQTVSRTTDLFGDGDDDEDAAAARRRREAELGADADMDEMLYEDDVADDDGQAAVDPADQDDEEAKEVEVCIHPDSRFSAIADDHDRSVSSANTSKRIRCAMVISMRTTMRCPRKSRRVQSACSG